MLVIDMEYQTYSCCIFICIFIISVLKQLFKLIFRCWYTYFHFQITTSVLSSQFSQGFYEVTKEEIAIQRFLGTSH